MTAPTTPELDPAETMVGTADGVGLWIGPEGTTPPATTDAPFTAPWRPLGYTSDDGPTISGDSTSEAITPWQSRSPIRTIITERTLTIAFILWQLNQDTLALYFSSDVGPAEDGELAFEVRTDQAAKVYALGLRVKDGDNAIQVCFSRATLDSAGDMQLQKGAMVPLDVTLSALDNAGSLASVRVKSGTDPSRLLNVTAEPSEDGAGADVQASPAVASPPAAEAPAAAAPDDAGVTTGPAATDSPDSGTTTTPAPATP